MLAGQGDPTGDNLMQIAYDAIKAIRERAGADPMAGIADIAGQNGLQLIRKERRKELAFENTIL